MACLKQEVLVEGRAAGGQAYWQGLLGGLLCKCPKPSLVELQVRDQLSTVLKENTDLAERLLQVAFQPVEFAPSEGEPLPLHLQLPVPLLVAAAGAGATAECCCHCMWSLRPPKAGDPGVPLWVATQCGQKKQPGPLLRAAAAECRHCGTACTHFGPPPLLGFLYCSAGPTPSASPMRRNIPLCADEALQRRASAAAAPVAQLFGEAGKEAAGQEAAGQGAEAAAADPLLVTPFSSAAGAGQ